MFKPPNNETRGLTLYFIIKITMCHDYFTVLYLFLTVIYIMT